MAVFQPHFEQEQERSEPMVELVPSLDDPELEEADDEEPRNARLSADEQLVSVDPLNLYVRQLGEGRLLTRSEERELARRKDMGDELEAAHSRLEPRMRHVLERRYGLDGQASQTLEELGVDLGVTRERVRQLKGKALRELRRSAPGLNLYLQV